MSAVLPLPGVPLDFAPELTFHHFAALQEANEAYWLDSAGWLYGPNVVRAPLPEASTQSRIVPRNLILHSNAGTRPATWRNLWNFMQSAGQNGEPTFDVDEVECAQAVSVFVRADCNAKANRWLSGSTYYGAVSIETSDKGAATLPVTPWSVPQLRHIIGISTALVVQAGIACTSPTRWDDTGIGHRCQYPEWSIYVGKTCPGAARIRQMDFIRQDTAARVGIYHQRCIARGVAPFVGRWYR